MSPNPDRQTDNREDAAEANLRFSKGSKHGQMHKLGDARGWTCQHCGRRVHCRVCEPRKPNISHATRDHLVPRSWGGKGGGNIVLACWRCRKCDEWHIGKASRNAFHESAVAASSVNEGCDLDV